MIKSFKDNASADIARGEASKAALKRLPHQLHHKARIKLVALDMAESLGDLSKTPGWALEKLRRDRAGQYSLRINKQYRICFRWTGEDAEQVEIVDYH